MLFSRPNEGILIASSTKGATPVELSFAEITNILLLRAELASRLPLLPVIYIPF